MPNDEDFILNCFKILMDPKATDDDLEALIDDVERTVAEEGLPPEEQRATDVKEAILLLVKQDSSTTIKELEYYLNKFYYSVEIARLVARHPSIDSRLLAHFTYFLPDDAAENPNVESYSKSEPWENDIQYMRPSNASPSMWGSSTVRGSDINPKRPCRYKVNYWLQHGSSKNKRYILSLELVDEELVKPFITDKSAHIRKEIACRSNLSTALGEKISQDKAKTVRLALAENKKCPESILVELTKDPEEAVRSAALSNTSCPEGAIHAAKIAEAIKPATPAKALNKLTDAELIELLGNPATDSKTLGNLVGFEQAYVKAGVALHVNCSVEILEKLALDTDIMVRQSVVFNSNTPNDILQDGLNSADNTCHIALASNPSLSEQQQLQLVDISNDGCRQILADTTELESVWCALRDSHPTQKKKGKALTWRDSLQILLNPNGKGLYALQRGYKTRQLFVSKLVSRHPKCPDSLKGYYAHYLFDSLAQNPNIALQLLENPNAIKAESYADWKLDKWLTDGGAPGHVSNFYLHSDDIKRRRRAAGNWSSCLRYVQPQIFYDDILMKKRVAERKGNTRFMFEILARDKKSSVRELVAKNKECHGEALAVLATDKVAAVKVAAKQNKNFKVGLHAASDANGKSEELKNKGPKRDRVRMAAEARSIVILKDLAGDKVDEVRLCVASNKKTSLETLTLLAKDKCEKVRAQVGRHDKASIDLLETLFGDVNPRVRLNALCSVNWRRSKSQETLPESHDDFDYSNRLYDEATLAHFYDDDDVAVQREIASHTSNIGIQKRIAEENVEQVCTTLARSRRLDSGVAAQMIKNKNRNVLVSLIRYTRDEDVYFNSLQADQTLAPELNSNYRMIEKKEIQAQLIAHDNEAVRYSCVYHVSDADLLMSLARDESIKIREDLAYNDNLKKEHVEALLDTPTVAIVGTLINHHSKLFSPFLPPLLESGNEEIRAHIAKNFILKRKWENKFREDDSVLVRKSLAENWDSELSQETLDILSADADEGVKKMALARSRE